MKPQSLNIIRLEQVAAALGDLKDKVVFTGGATVELYLSPTYRSRVRPTKDIDCIIEVRNRIDYSRFEESLRKHGFRDAALTIPGAPICRWLYEDTLIDFMPTDKSILGFSNRWFPEALQQLSSFRLPSGTEIAICSLPYFLAIKLEAFEDRGVKDPRTSTDLEDIVTLIDGVAEIDSKLSNAPASVKDYLKKQFRDLSVNEDFVEGIECNAVLGFEQAERVMRFVKRLSTGL